jgi:simple sugar transport system substrate-binding protein
MAKVTSYVLAIVLLIIGIVAGYYAGFYTAPQKVITTTVTVTPQVPAYTVPEKIKAAWIYVGPVGDFGWSYMHDVGRRVTAELFKDWLETTYVENIRADQAPAVIDELVKKGYTIIFTTSFDFMDQTLDKAMQYPNILFFHCSGYKRWKNMGTYLLTSTRFTISTA